MSVKEGDPAPGFELPGTGGCIYRLSDYAGRELVLAFYPGDFTTVCTRQLCSYRDSADRFEEVGVEVLGISPQSVDSHERFAAEHGLGMPLLADEDLSVARAYGVKIGPAVRRAIFVIDGDGLIRHRKVSLLSLTYEGADEIAEAVAAAREG